MTDYPSRWETDVVLTDGGSVHIRPIRPDDAERLVQFHGRQSAESIYYRFFSPRPHLTEREVARFTTVDYDTRMAFVAQLGDDMIGVARYDTFEPFPDGTPRAEVAFFVDDRHHGRGLATLLLEFLAVAAAERGIGGFVATVLPNNRGMINVFRRAGFEVSTSFSDGVVEVVLGIQPTEEGRDRIDERAQRSEARSVARLMTPATVAVVGASRQPGKVGHEVVRQLVSGDFNGAVYPVNLNAAHVRGMRAYPTVTTVPDEVDLAIICVPIDQVDAVMADCVQKRVGGVVVATEGFRRLDAGRARALVSVARRNGMRLLGPASIGMVNHAADVRLRASVAPLLPPPGRVALSTQSGSLGNAILSYATEAGVGLSAFVNLGDKGDISANDLLQYWQDDDATAVVTLYVESFGNPRKFFRIARTLGGRKPLVVMRTASLDERDSTAWPGPATLSALMAQAGVIEVESLAELFDAARLLVTQPLPAGRRVAVVASSPGAAALGTETARRSGLDAVPYVIDGEPEELAAAVVSAAFDAVPTLGEPGFVVPDRPSAARLAGALAAPDRTMPNGMETDGPDGDRARDRARDRAGDRAGDPAGTVPDAALVVFAPTASQGTAEVAEAIDRAVAARLGAGQRRPVLACFLAEPMATAPLAEGEVPRFRFPEDAARALARAVRYARWRSQSKGEPLGADLDRDAVQAVVGRGLAGAAGGVAVTLGLADTVALLAAAGLAPVQQREADGLDEAVAIARQIGYPVALKTRRRGRLARSASTGLALDLHDEDELREAARAMREGVGDAADDLIVQAMAEPGIDAQIVGHQDPRLGPLVALGRGGVLGSDPHELAVRMVPVTDLDAGRLIRASPLRGLLERLDEPATVAALEAVLGRVSALMEHVPELVEVRLDPVMISNRGVALTDVQVTVAPLALPLEPSVRRIR